MTAALHSFSSFFILFLYPLKWYAVGCYLDAATCHCCHFGASSMYVLFIYFFEKKNLAKDSNENNVLMYFVWLKAELSS